ncbi:MAG: class I SAM-dependent methyltransferase [Phycisphaerales bacterium]|nr:class I SAM-dependent methyltransferase [Phycisphaerales bacterium]
MSTERPADYLEPYRDAVQTYGASFEATLWGSRAAQQMRFDVMIDLAGFEGCTVVDAGCGQGDFAAHLLERAVPFRSFIGIDGMAPMVEAARSRALARSTFEVADLVREPARLVALAPDWVTFSGTLNTMDDATAQGVVRAAFDAAAQGVIFNFLSDRHHARWAARVLAPARRFDTLAWLDWSLGLSSRVQFTQTYLDGHDATILIRHDEDAAA